MPKEASLANLMQDLNYIVYGTYVHDELFKICPPHKGLRVCEPGCGSAKFAIAYALHGSDIYAFDIDKTAVAYACRLRDALKALIGQFEFYPTITEGNIFKIPQSWNDEFDLVFNEGVPQHFLDERREVCIKNMVRITKPGGMVVIIGNNGLNSHEQWIDENFEFKYEGMPPKRKCFTPDELEELMRKAGLQSISCNPLHDMGYGRISWEEARLIIASGVK